MYAGAGDYYFSRRDFRLKKGSCTHCNRKVTLKSFTAFKVVHVNFIPLIPSGWFRVTDFCNNCERWSSDIKLKKYKKIKKESLEELENLEKQNKEDITTIIKRIYWEKEYGDIIKAEKLAIKLEQNHPKDQKVIQFLIYWSIENSQYDLAKKMLNHLEEDNDYTKRLKINNYIFNLDFRKALKLYRSINQYILSRDFYDLRELAVKITKKGDSRLAYEVYELMIQEFPEKVGAHSAIRNEIKKIEKEIRVFKSIVPFNKNRNKDSLIGASIIAIALIAIASIYTYYYFHQPLYIYNGLSYQVEVSVDSNSYVIEPLEILEIQIEEGDRIFSVYKDGHKIETGEYSCKNDFISRVYNHRTFIYNVGGAGLIFKEELLYSDREDVSGEELEYNVFI